MQLVKNSLEKIINEIIETSILRNQLTFDGAIRLSVSTIAEIMYLLETKDIDGLKLFKLKNFYFLNDEIYRKEIPAKICRIVNCNLNDETFTKKIDVSSFGDIILTGKPDAFYNYKYPVEIKSILNINTDVASNKRALEKYLEKNRRLQEGYGRNQAKLYAYLLNKTKTCLIISTYIPFKNDIKITRCKISFFDVNLKEVDSIVKEIIEKRIVPYLKNKI